MARVERAGRRIRQIFFLLYLFSVQFNLQRSEFGSCYKVLPPLNSLISDEAKKKEKTETSKKRGKMFSKREGKGMMKSRRKTRKRHRKDEQKRYLFFCVLQMCRCDAEVRHRNREYGKPSRRPSPLDLLFLKFHPLDLQRWHICLSTMLTQTSHHGVLSIPHIIALAIYWPCLDTPAGLELELVSNSSSSPKLTLALEVFGWKG
jgi:hypothetical protein